MKLRGTVIRGDGRGRALGFPTANLEPISPVDTPPAGVYAGFATHDGTRYLAAIHIGPRPTFPGSTATIEAHLLDFDEDIYDEVLTLDVEDKLRDIVKFDTITALQDAIAQDCATVRKILEL